MRKSLARVALSILSLSLASSAVGCVGDEVAPPTPGAGETGPATQAPSASSSGGPGGENAPSVAPPAEPKPKPEEKADAGPGASAQVLGYVYSHAAAADESTPGAMYAYNAGGGAMKIARTSVGEYTVTFGGLAADGTVALVSGYDMTGGLCHWTSTSGSDVKVRCLDASGSKADARFSLTVVGQGSTGASILGFAHANDKSAASYEPQTSRSNNAVGGGKVTATRTAVGTYKMEFAGLALGDIGNVQVMPYGAPDAYCSVKSWGGSTVNVLCYDAGGAPADAQYTVMLAGQKQGGTARIVAYALANEGANASYAPPLAHSSADGAVTATRTAPGTYAIVFEGQNLSSAAHVQLTSQGQGRRCNASAWAGNTVNLTCANNAGAATDSSYAIVVLR